MRSKEKLTSNPALAANSASSVSEKIAALSIISDPTKVSSTQPVDSD